jgi:hypothetical protein
MALSDLLTAMDAKIEAVLSDDATDWFDYRIGDKTVTKSEYLKFLIRSRQELLEMPADTPAVDLMWFDYNVDETTGADDSEYVT